LKFEGKETAIYWIAGNIGDVTDYHHNNLTYGGNKMALTAVQQNLVSAMQASAEEILSLKGVMEAIVAMYASEGMTAITDEDLQIYDPFAHITVNELTAAKNAYNDLKTALGGYVGGEAAYKLMRIVGKVPK